MASLHGLEHRVDVEEVRTWYQGIPWPHGAPSWAGLGPGEGHTTFPHNEWPVVWGGPVFCSTDDSAVCHKQPGSRPPCSAGHTRWTLAADLGPVPRPGAAGRGRPSCSIRGAPQPLWPLPLSALGCGARQAGDVEASGVMTSGTADRSRGRVSWRWHGWPGARQEAETLRGAECRQPAGDAA